MTDVVQDVILMVYPNERVALPGDSPMNVTESVLTAALQLAADSGKVESGRLHKAHLLIPKINMTFRHVYTDGSRIDEYWIPGSAHTGYVVTVRDGKHLSACTCKDSQERKVEWCKHRLAVALIVRCGELAPGSVTANVPTSETALSERFTTLLADPEYRRKTLANMFQQDDSL